MKILKNLIEKMESTLEEIEYYAEKAHYLKTEHKAVADCFIKIAEMHEDIYRMLHDKAVMLIEEYKKAGNEPPKEMLLIWEYSHERLVKKFSEARFLTEEYHKSY